MKNHEGTVDFLKNMSGNEGLKNMSSRNIPDCNKLKIPINDSFTRSFASL